MTEQSLFDFRQLVEDALADEGVEILGSGMILHDGTGTAALDVSFGGRVYGITVQCWSTERNAKFNTIVKGL